MQGRRPLSSEHGNGISLLPDRPLMRAGSGPGKLKRSLVPPSKSHFFLTYFADLGPISSPFHPLSPVSYADDVGLHPDIFFVPNIGLYAWENTYFPRN